MAYAEYDYKYDHKFEPAPIGHDGKVVDTHEVAYEKKLHAKAQEEALEKLHHAAALDHESYEKYPHYRTAHSEYFFFIFQDLEYLILIIKICRSWKFL